MVCQVESDQLSSLPCLEYFEVLEPFWEMKEQITLNMEESHHLAKVLRRRIGDHVELLDGQGGVACAEMPKGIKGGSNFKDFKPSKYSIHHPIHEC